MAQGRLSLHETLVEVAGAGWMVYFQPPHNLEIVYPCIVYKRDYAVTDHANNSPYRHNKRYMATVIDPDPDSLVPDKLAALPLSVFVRHFTSENLNHDIFNIYS